jgi:hypothetical protein
MPSSFPGMDPYLEQSGGWRDFHLEFISCLRNRLTQLRPDNYDARIEERLIIPEKERQNYIEIYDYAQQALVTVLEVLSPSNKLAKGREEYLIKRDAILSSDAHLVELDLLVNGQRLPTAEPYPQDDYYAFVARAECRPLCDVYHWSVRQSLPAIPIPLKSPDPDVIVELQPVFTEAFARGRYERRLHYGTPPRTRISRADRQWAAELAAAARAEKR